MRLADLDQHPTGSRPLAQCLQWLSTCLRSPAQAWSPEQRAAAQQALDEAQDVLGMEIACDPR